MPVYKDPQFATPSARAGCSRYNGLETPEQRREQQQEANHQNFYDSKQDPFADSPSLKVTDLPEWQSVLTENDPRRLEWPITRLCLPGTHDSGTYGPGTFPTNVARFNWNCQSHNFYGQAQLGIRYFDLRLARASDSSPDSKFWPFHGAARKTGDLFADGPNGNLLEPSESAHTSNRWQKTIAGQLLKFVHENPTELIVLHLTIQDSSKFKDTAWETLLNTLNESGRCIPSPDTTNALSKDRIPTIAEVRSRGQNFVIIADSKPSTSEDARASLGTDAPETQVVATFVKDFIWKMPGSGVLRGPYTSSIWKMNNPEVIQKAIQDWMTRHEATIVPLTHFWAAQCQLTPSVNNFCDIVSSLWNPNMTTKPSKLSPIMNPYVKNVLMQDSLWRQRVSIVQVDFPDADTVLGIVNVNFDSSRQ